jgi:hypothetical protein
MRAIVAAMLTAAGIGLIGASGSTAAPSSGAVLLRAASDISPVVHVRAARAGTGYRSGTGAQSRHPTVQRPAPSRYSSRSRPLRINMCIRFPARCGVNACTVAGMQVCQLSLANPNSPGCGCGAGPPTYIHGTCCCSAFFAC